MSCLSNQHLSRLHRRLDGLAKVIDNKLVEADSPGRPMSMRERADLRFILSRIKTMLRDDQREAEQTVEDGGEMPVRHSKQYLNTQCEFFDVDSNRIQCAIGCDMYRCSRNCIYATNVPGSLPPYCTKYMKGWIDR